MAIGGEGGRGRGRKRGSSPGQEEGRGREREIRHTPQWDYKRWGRGGWGGARAVVALLVAGSQVGSVQAYSCTSDAQCQYKGCNDNSCSLCELVGTCNCRSAGMGQQARSCTVAAFDCTSVTESLYQSNGKWKAICTGGVCDRWGDDFGSCPEPAPCPAGTYSGTGKNEAGDKACRPCDAGKYTPNTGLSSSVCVCVCVCVPIF